MRLNPGAPQTLSHQYADCFIDPGQLPEDLVAAAEALVTGTLGLACQPTADTMLRDVVSHLAAQPTGTAALDARPFVATCNLLSSVRANLCNHFL